MGEELMLEKGSTCKAHETDFLFVGLHVPCFSNVEILIRISKYVNFCSVRALVMEGLNI